jgi:DNA-binding transcriptional ArsR family regulator
VDGRRLMEEKAKKIAELLKILGNENRLLILCALLNGSRTVGEIHTYTPNITPSALSQHLNRLKTAGIIASQKTGMKVTCSIADPRVTEIIGALRKYYCD